MRLFRNIRKSLVLPTMAFLMLTMSLGHGATTDSAKVKKKNIIVMISDGCGYAQIDAASMFYFGQTGSQVYQSFPYKFGMATFCDGGQYDPEKAWGDFDWLKKNPTDSAAAATAMACGEKTYKGSIGLGPDKKAIPNVVERAEAAGMATGVITSVPFSHATPAGFVAHNKSRENYKEIAKEMITSSSVDVIMGGGHPWYDGDGVRKKKPNDFKYVGGETLWKELKTGSVGADANGDGKADPWTLIEDREEFQKLAEGGPAPDRLLGVAKVYQTLQQGRGGASKAAAYIVPFNLSVPTLDEMALAAINVLDNDPDGFFLMIEGGAIDWAGHSNQSGRSIEEEIAFNHTVECVIKWIGSHGGWEENTLIVTGDHETGYLNGPGSDPERMALVNNGKGVMPGMEWHSGDHTNQLIPIFINGEEGKDFQDRIVGFDRVRGHYVDNTSIAKVIFECLK